MYDSSMDIYELEAAARRKWVKSIGGEKAAELRKSSRTKGWERCESWSGYQVGELYAFSGPVDDVVVKKVGRKKRVRLSDGDKAYRHGWCSGVLSERKTECGRCGYKEFPSCLDWHHTDRSTKVESVSRMMDLYRVGREFTQEDILLEIDKCIPLCKNCHMAFHRGCWR